MRVSSIGSSRGAKGASFSPISRHLFFHLADYIDAQACDLRLVIGLLGAVALARALSAITIEFADAFLIGTNDPLLGTPLLLAGLALLALSFAKTLSGPPHNPRSNVSLPGIMGGFLL